MMQELLDFYQEYKEKSKNIAAKHTQNFIEKLDAIIKQESENIVVARKA